eukprot:TRINITY_DN301_c3_g1_i1.p1 TRINITY_DN301_c3_g1~~TRINITY_DN301_c3_g1_i1.p1  ORF type:complete len:478 (+),score=77.89 TRINITY_DN301_c3_g1_i1:64-1434(+)
MSDTTPADEQTTPVAFVRQLPSDCTEADLEELGAKFGKVSGVRLIEGKSMGFIEFESTDLCKNAIKICKEVPPTIRGKEVDLKGSTREKVTKAIPAANVVLLVTVGPSHKDSMGPNLDSLPDTLYTFFSSVTPRVLRIVCFKKKSIHTQGLVEFSTVGDALLAKQQLEGRPLPSGHPIKIQTSSTVPPLKVDQQNTKARDFTTMNPMYSRSEPVREMSHPSTSSEGCVLLVSRIPEKNGITPQQLFNLFSTCGDVMRVKILFKKRDSALIQYRDVSQARTARINLNGVILHGTKLVVTGSKQRDISMPQADSSEEAFDLTKDFSDSQLHRFRVPNSKNFKHIVPPDRILHVSNIPDGATSEEMNRAFSPYGPMEFNHFKSDRKMGLVSYRTVDHAINALMDLHGTLLPGYTGYKLSITFSDFKNKAHYHGTSHYSGEGNANGNGNGNGYHHYNAMP